jgi:hypothetical protein
VTCSLSFKIILFKSTHLNVGRWRQRVWASECSGISSSKHQREQQQQQHLPRAHLPDNEARTFLAAAVLGMFRVI